MSTAEPTPRRWVKSSVSAENGECVEAALGADRILVRDSTQPDGPLLAFAPAAWRAFLRDAFLVPSAHDR